MTTCAPMNSSPRSASSSGSGAAPWVLLGLLALAAACSSTTTAPGEPAPSPAGGSPEDGSPGQGPQAASQEDGDSGQGTDQDGRVDDAGRRYTVREIPKHEGYYRWVGEDRVRLSNSLTYFVEDHDEDSFLVRVYRAEDLGSGSGSEARSEPEPEPEPEAQSGSQTVTPRAVDRLTVEDFGTGLPRRGQWRNGFAVADIDGDGFLDIVHGPRRKGFGRPEIFLGDGQGQWRRWTEARFSGPELDYGDVAVADFDGDGNLDLAFAVHLRGIVVFVSDGGGDFREWSEGIEYVVPGGGRRAAQFSSRTIEAVDWNGDGRPDLLALGEGPRMARPSDSAAPAFHPGSEGPALFLNQGDGSWEPVGPEDGSDGARHFGDSLTVADFDGDGQPDFATATAALRSPDILHLHGEEPRSGWRQAEIPGLRKRAFLRSVEAADLDGDGRPDLAVGYIQRSGPDWLSGIDVLLNTAEGWEREEVVREEGRIGFWALASGDLDGDGVQDLIALDDEGKSRVLLGEGAGRFVLEESPELRAPELGCQGYHLELADLDGDGTAEVVAAFAGEPGSEVLLGVPPACTSQGALLAWRVTPAGSRSTARR